MKRAFILIISLLCLSVTHIYAADAFTFNGLRYNILSPSTVEVTYFAVGTYSGDIIIPSTVTNNANTYSVTSIGPSAFRDCSNLTSIDIPSSVTYIGERAFESCKSLTSVTIPSSVTSIGEHAFYLCSGLTSVTIPSSVTSIGRGAFCLCRLLTSIYIPEGVTSIDANVFQDCRSLTSVTIPSSVTNIGSNAFMGCSGLTSVTIPSSVTSIGEFAFGDCSGLTSIDIPSSVTSIGEGAFGSCSGLTSVTIPEGVTSIGIYAFQGCSGLTSIIIPSSVTSIGDEAFHFCTSLTSIILPSSVTSIGEYAFYNCSSLTSVLSNIEVPFRFGSQAFYGIANDCVLTVPAGTRDAYIAAGWTENKFKGGVVEASKNIDFADANVKALCVANWDTNGDGELSETEAAAVTNLGEVFKGNGTIQTFEELQYFTGLTSIGEIAFAGCSGLTSVTIPNSVTSIGAFAFDGCSGLTSITIPNSVTSIGTYAFRGCSGLTSVTIPNSVTSIGRSAFSDCSSLTSVNIPSSVTSIGEFAFSYCSGLTSVTIPSSVTSIGYNAFAFCSGLTSLTIPSSVTSIGTMAFYYCSGLTSVKVASGNPVYDSRDNCNAIIKTATNTLISGCKSTVIPNSVTSIGRSAFYGCSGLTSVTIPNSVKSIGESAFRGCSGLTSVTIPNSVTSIGNYAFSGCSGLTSLTIPNSVTSIGKQAFYYCSGLTSVVAEMETPFAFGDAAFVGISSSGTLTVPAGTRDAYIAAGWTEDVFKGGVVEAPAPVVLATSVTINEETLSLTTVGETATLTATVLPENVTDGSVTWTSSDESVATVSSDGIVTAVANGTAIITATTNDESNLSATCTVTVNIGDLNNDGTVDVADVMSVINIILELAEETCAADVNGDGSVDIGDIMAIVNIIIKQNSESTPAKRRVRSATTSDDVVVLRKNSGRYAVSLDNEQIYTAFQMTVSVPDGRELKSVEFCDSRLGQFTKVIRPLSDGRYLIMGFSMSGNAISGTVGEIFSLDCESECDITLQNVVFSTPEARSYMLEVAYETGEATAIRANQTMDIHIVGNTVYVDCDKEQQLSVFNLGGSIVKQVRLSQGENAFTLPDGQYIIRNKKISILSK